MTTPSFSVRRPGAANLTIRPPSPTGPPAPVIHQGQGQGRPTIPSPTHSNRSSSTQGAGAGYPADHAHAHARRGSFETSRSGGNGEGSTQVGKQRIGLPPWVGNLSPSRRGESQKGGYAGAYDNKLVSSTVSHLPPIPPLSPTPTGGTSAQMMPHTRSYDLNHLHPNANHLGTSRRPTGISSSSASASSSNVAASVIVLPDGTVLSSAGTGSKPETRSVAETMAHSSANSPWNVLIMHVLPVFGGGPVHTSIEELNGLSMSHIIASSGRVPTSRLIAVLASDLREFIGSGMLTFKAKFDNYDEIKLVARVAEQWSFFWSQVLPYLEGILLPFTQIKEHSKSPIHVRNLLLTGFLLQIIQPILSRLIEIIALAPSSTSPTNTLHPYPHPTQLPQPTETDLQRVLQMSLVLATQAKCSSFYPFRSADENREHDKQVRDNVDALGKAVRWRMNALRRSDSQAGGSATGLSVGAGVGVTDEYGAPRDGNAVAPKRHSIHRGPSLSQSGRFRRRGWRASANMSQVYGDEALASGAGGPSRQNSDFGSLYHPPQDAIYDDDDDYEDEDDNNTTPGQSYAAGAGTGAQSKFDNSYATTMISETPTTYTGTAPWRGREWDRDSASQRTPQAGMAFPRRRQTSGNASASGAGSRESTPGPPEVRRRDTGRV